MATVGAGPAQTTYLIGASELDAASVWTKNPHPDIRKVVPTGKVSSGDAGNSGGSK